MRAPVEFICTTCSARALRYPPGQPWHLSPPSGPPHLPTAGAPQSRELSLRLLFRVALDPRVIFAFLFFPRTARVELINKVMEEKA